MTPPRDIRLGYLMVSSPVPNVFIGGAMVTDGRGLPIEFRYTEPIQPTKIQQILYGQVLAKYIKTEVIFETLLKNLESKFKVLLVEDDGLLGCPAKDFSVVRVAETKSPPLSEVGRKEELSANEVLLQTNKEGNPIRLLWNAETPGGTKTVGAAAPQPADAGAPVCDALVEAGQFMDVHEPLRRIEKALETICQEAGILQPTK